MKSHCISCSFMLFVASNLSVSKVSTYKGLATLIVALTCIIEGHPSTCVNKTVIYQFTFHPSCVLSQLELPTSLDPTQACHNCSDEARTSSCAPPSSALPSPPFSISLTFIFTLIELNKEIMFDIKSLWTCGPADRCVCLFFHSKCFTLSGLCLFASLGSVVPVIAYLEFPVSICFELTPRCCYAGVTLLSLNVFPNFCLVCAFTFNSVCIHTFQAEPPKPDHWM